MTHPRPNGRDAQLRIERLRKLADDLKRVSTESKAVRDDVVAGRIKREWPLIDRRAMARFETLAPKPKKRTKQRQSSLHKKKH